MISARTKFSLIGITAQAINAKVIVIMGAKIKIILFALAGTIISFKKYLCRDTLATIVMQPLAAIESEKLYDIKANVTGGGLTGQAGAIRLGISRALLNVNKDFRSILKSRGYLTRDARKVERKKPGQPGARANFQFSKR